MAVEIEQRVQILEQEVQLLKGQIQAILLDIQEQLLTNAYPSLRTDERPAENLPPPTVLDPGSTSRPVRRVVLDENNAPDESEASHEPYMPRVTAAKVAPVHSPAMPSAAESQMSLAEMEQWVREKVKEMGVKRTQKLVTMYAQKGQFDRETKETLLELASLYDEEVAAKPRHSESADFFSPKPTPVAQNRSRADGRSQAAAPRQAAVAQPSTQPKKSAPLKDSHSRDARSQVSAPSAAQRTNHTRSQPQTQPSPRSQAATRQPGPVATEETEHHPRRNIILKLIAGIENAGAGVRWNKRNG